ncbi:hypothetical protein V6N12_018401 [Hibiscus sabdariffa]|uniref:Uncharacterized protein n=1 Tax=Hibiscus sabdariffa TaxID=183260 RepID=A0ABR2BRU7_9ROSI
MTPTMSWIRKFDDFRAIESASKRKRTSDDKETVNGLVNSIRVKFRQVFMVLGTSYSEARQESGNETLQGRMWSVHERQVNMDEFLKSPEHNFKE